MKAKDIINETRSPSDDLMGDRLVVPIGGLPDSHFGDIGRTSPHRGDPIMSPDLGGGFTGAGGGRGIPRLSGAPKAKSSTDKQTFKDLNPKDLKGQSASKSLLDRLFGKAEPKADVTKKRVEPSLGDVKQISGTSKQVTPSTGKSEPRQSVSGKVEKPKVEREPGETVADAIKRAQAKTEKKPLSKEAEKFKKEQEAWKDWQQSNKDAAAKKAKDQKDIADKETGGTKKRVEPELKDVPATNLGRSEPNLTGKKREGTPKVGREKAGIRKNREYWQKEMPVDTIGGKVVDKLMGIDRGASKASGKSAKQSSRGRVSSKADELDQLTTAEKRALKVAVPFVAGATALGAKGYYDSLQGDEEQGKEETPDTSTSVPSSAVDNEPAKGSEQGSEKADAPVDNTAVDTEVKPAADISVKPISKPSDKEDDVFKSASGSSEKPDELAHIKKLSGAKDTTPKASKVVQKVAPKTDLSSAPVVEPKSSEVSSKATDTTKDTTKDTADTEIEKEVTPPESKPGEYDKTDTGLFGGKINYRTDKYGTHWIANPQKQSPALQNLNRGAPDEVPYITSSQVSDTVNKAKAGVKSILGMNEDAKANEDLALLKRLSGYRN